MVTDRPLGGCWVSTERYTVCWGLSSRGDSRRDCPDRSTSHRTWMLDTVSAVTHTYSRRRWQPA